MSFIASAPSGTSSASSAPLSSFTLPRAIDDFHLHIRDGDAILRDVLRPMLTRRTVARAILMPNLQPPVTNAKMALEYRERVRNAVGEIQQEMQTAGTEKGGATAATTSASSSSPRIDFTPLMTLYLTDATTPDEIKEAKESGIVYACKLYPKGATTHSNQGVTNLENLFPVFRAMATHRLLLLVHGEVTDPSIDIFDRESSFLPELEKVLVGVPELRVVLEHVTTRAGVQFVQKHVKEGRHLAATITAHHLLYSRNALFEGGLNPHLYCLPILKTEVDRAALLSAVLDPAFASTRHRFFCGTDSAPHPRANKEKSCGCAAGCFTAFATGELYLEGLVDEAQRRGLTAEESHSVITAFLTSNGAQFYDLPLNQEREIRFVRREWKVDESMPFGAATIIPLRAGKTIAWQLADETSAK